jgi:hypothetical protein
MLRDPVSTAAAAIRRKVYMQPSRFDLGRLLKTVFSLEGGERYGVFTDLADLAKARDLAFLADPALKVQRHAYRTFFEGLRRLDGPLAPARVDFYLYEETGGSNLDLPGTVVTAAGEARPQRTVLAGLDIVLYVSRYSATAPITALAKEMGFRGATLHGTNDAILATGLSADYEKVSRRAERLRSACDGADEVRMELTCAGRTHVLTLDLRGRAAQKSHGLVRTLGDIANLPAGEVYFVPRDAWGAFPQRFEDEAGTIAVLEVERGGIVRQLELVQGSQATVDRALRVIAEDPNAGQITELGLGTQSLPFAGADIQDEKILGTAHIATGRSDHLGGGIDSKAFKNPRNASHNDILFAPPKTPEVDLRVVMTKGGREEVLIESYAPSAFVKALVREVEGADPICPRTAAGACAAAGGGE